jgi:glutamine synthetase
LVPAYEAPTYITWAEVNRSDLIRIPSFKPDRKSSRRIEYRAPDPSCNPYLAFSVMLAAGLEGIDNKYEMPASLTKSVHEMSEEERTSLGIESLPGNLWEAIQVTEQSDLVKKTLGDSVFNSFIENKKIEWNRYSSQISAYEVERYLPIL